MIDFKDLNNLLRHHARSLISDISPGGKLVGGEYTCATVQGGAGTSCKINVNTCKWMDGATGEKGGDLISLYAAAENVSQIEAAKAMAAKVGYKIEEPARKGLPAPSKKAVYQSEEKIEREYKLEPVPDTVPEPMFFHFQFGACSGKWLYLGPSGERLFWVSRHDLKDGSKQFIPWSWDASVGQIVNKAWNVRPLYGLELLAMNPGKPVMIVEGEKAADAARKFIKKYIVVSWMGGANGFSKTDWSPLYGRKNLIWPDNDLKVAKKQLDADKYGIEIGERIPIEAQPGMKAALGIAEILSPHCEVKFFSFHEQPMIGDIDGFDAADALAMGWTWEMFLETVKPIVKVFKAPPPAPLPEIHKEESTEFVQGSAFQVCQDAGIELDGKGKPLVTISTVKKMLEYHPVWKNKIWFDNFHLKILTNWRTSSIVEWSDLDDLKVCEIFQNSFKMHKMTGQIINCGVQLYAHENQKNEPRDWINEQKWDGTERIREFFIKGLGSKDTLYTRQASQNFCIAMVARVFEPGIKFDHMVILEGEQGKQKSTALQAIAGKWFGESTEHITSKDFAICLQGKLIIEIAELSAFSAAEVEAVKKVITIQSDRFRPPYGRGMVTYPRTSVFVGTTNKDDYLQDSTGARRFWPVRIGQVDINYIKENRAQLFAEALVRFREGLEYWVMPDDETKAEQESRREKDHFEDVLKDWITGNWHDQVSLDPAKIYETLGFSTEKIDKRIQNRVGKVMRVLGWEYKPKWFGSDQRRVWVKRDPNDLN